MLRRDIFFLLMKLSNIARLTNTAVNILAAIPIHRVIANPLIGPVPNWNKTTAAMKVVILASTMVLKALAYPASIAARTVFPTRISSRMRSNIKTLASIAIPTVSNIPAIPGSVSAAPK